MKDNLSNNESSLDGSVFSKSSYIDIIYSEERKPKTPYPKKLAKYILSQKIDFDYQGRTLLDIGCGKGEMLEAFHSMGLKVTGVDLSPSSKQACEPHEVFVSNIEKNPLPFSDNSFDFIFSKSVIEHLRSPIELMEEAYRVLKPGGVAIIMTPSWVHNYSGSFYLDHTHVSPFTRPSLRDIALMTKFENVFVQHFYQLPFLWRFPALLPCVKLFGKLPLPYKPMNDVCLHPSVNTLIRFSREVMLLCVARKPLQ